MDENHLDKTSATGTQTRPIGRVLRFLLGGLLIAILVPYYRGANWESNLIVLGIVIALVLLYALMHYLISNYLPQINRWRGACLALVPVILVYVLGGSHGRMGALTFLGVSLVLASLRGDSGCEVMSIPGIMFKKRTHLVCVVFSPIDWLEEKIFGRV